MVGAQSPSEAGLFYQWGDIVGHAIADDYDFSSANYEAKGLNLISSDLDDAHDAARAYYGPEAKMPSSTQLQELITNCVISYQGNAIYLITSNINGRSFKIHGNGYINNQEHLDQTLLHAWSNTHNSDSNASSMIFSIRTATILQYVRHYGLNIFAVHS